MLILQWPFGRGLMSRYKTSRSSWTESLLWTCCDPVILQSSSHCLLGPPPSSSTSSRTGTMESSGMLRGLLFVGLLSVLCHGQASKEVSVEDFGEENAESAADKELMEALGALLGRIHNPISTEKRASIPMCGMGDRCAMKFGPRIGKLCDCGRGANCNSYLLKCI